MSMTDREKEIYDTLRKCPDKPCVFGVECPYSKYGDLCVRRLMRDAADYIKVGASYRKDCI